MRRRGQAAICSLLLLALVALVPVAQGRAAPPTGGTTVVNESFAGTSVADANWLPLGATCLTAMSSTATPPPGAAAIPNCNGRRVGPVPAQGVGPGYLQLTDAATQQRGGMIYQRPIPA